MSIQQIGRSQVPPGPSTPESYFDALASRGTPETNGASSHGDPVDRASIAPLSAKLNQEIQIHRNDNAAAKQIRTKDEAMRAFGDTLDKMSGSLEAIVKNYPPFPQGSEERVRWLRSYSGLREVIERLTIPPDTGEAGTLRAGQKTEEPAAPLDNWVLSIDSHGKTRTVPKEEVRTGPSGLSIPVLDPPETIDDLAINDALDTLNAARRFVDAGREQLHATSLAEGPASFNGGDTPQRDSRAMQTSAVVREDLAGRPVSIASGGFAQLDQLLG